MFWTRGPPQGSVAQSIRGDPWQGCNRSARLRSGVYQYGALNPATKQYQDALRYASAADLPTGSTRRSRLRRTRLAAISISNSFLTLWDNFKKDLLGLQKLAQKAMTRRPACLTDPVRDLAAICGNCRALAW